MAKSIRVDEKGEVKHRTWTRLTGLRLMLLAAAITTTPVWGEERSSTATVGGRFGSDYGEAYLSIFAPLNQKENSLIFINPRFALKDEGASEGNLGIGFRHLLPNQNAIFGANLYVDRSRTEFDNDFDQWGLGLEFLTDSWDFRANYYDPGNSTVIAATSDVSTLSSVTEVMRAVQTQETVSRGIVASNTDTVSSDRYRFNYLINRLTSTTTDVIRTTTDIKETTTSTFTKTDTFTDLFFEKREGGLDGYDLELGYKFPLAETLPEVRLFGGYYDFDGPFNSEIKGAKGRLEVRAGEYFTFDAEVFEDKELHGSDYFIGARINLPFSFTNLVNGKNPFLTRKHDMISFRNRPLVARLGEEVMRDVNVHVAESGFSENLGKRQVKTEQTVTVEVDVVETSSFTDQKDVNVAIAEAGYTLNGDFVDITHVNSNATGADAGTFENPNQTLTSANATQAAAANDIVLVHSDSSFSGETLNVTDNQMIVGQGGGNNTAITTDQGNVVLPEAGNPTGATPVISGPGGGVQIGSSNVLVTNLTLTNGSSINTQPGAHDNLTLTNISVSNATGDAINLGGGGTLDGSITLENINVANATGNGIVLENVLSSATVTASNLTTANNAQNGLAIANGAAGASFNFNGFQASSNTFDGIRLDNTDGTFVFNSPSILSGGGNGIDIRNGSSGTFTFTDATITDTAGAGINIENTAANINFNGITSITDPGVAGINLDNNTGSLNVGTTNIDLGTTAGTAGINYQGSNAATSFGAVTITDVGTGANQVGIDLNGANLTGAMNFDSVAITGSTLSADSIGVDLTGLQGNQLVNMGSSADPAAGPSSSIIGTHRGVVIDAIASVQFTFGDGENPLDAGSTIDVNNVDDFSFTVDAGMGTLGSASFNFDDVVVGTADEANFPAAPADQIFVSTTGGTVIAGTNGLSQDVNTIDTAAAEALANTGQTFIFVGDASGFVDVSAGFVDGLTLATGQRIDGFNNGNSFIFGTLQPANISGNLGAAGGAITANSATVINSNRGASSIVNVAGGSSTVANNIFDGTLDVAWTGTPPNNPVAIINIAGAGTDVTISGVDLTNIGIIPVIHSGINLDGNAGNVTLVDVATTGTNAGTVLQIDSANPSTGQVTSDATTVLGGTTGTVVSVGTGMRDVNLGASTITSSLNTTSAIDIEGQTGGTITFGDVTLNGSTGPSAIQVTNQTGGTLTFGTVDVGGMTGFNNAAGTAVNIQGAGGAVNFTELDINASNGDALIVEAQTLSIANSANDITTANGVGLRLDGTDLGAGLTLNQLNSSNGTNGVLLLNVIGNLDINGGAINNATSDSFVIAGGTGDVSYSGDINHNSANSAVFVLGHSTGTVTFDIGTIGVTNGLGLQFNNADGAYDFAGVVTLNGGDAGIDILNGSAGTFTFANTTITDPTGVALNIDGSDANVTYSGGSITQSNNAAAVNVNNHASGTINVGVDINATNGDGLQFNNADGTYNFNTMTGTTSLNGGDAGIDILGGSAGTFTFTDPTINNTAAGIGINIDNGGAAATVTFDGLDVTTNSNTGIFIDNNTGTVTVSNTTNGTSVNSTGGPGIDANGVNLDVTFDSVSATNGAGINLDTTTGTFTVGSAAGAAGSGGALNINGGNAVNINGGSVVATFNSMAVNANGGTAVNIVGGTSGNISFINTDVAQTGTGRAINIDGSTAGNILFDAAGSISATVAGNTGVNINNTDANVTLATATLRNTLGDTVTISGGTGLMNLSNVDISNAGGDGVQVTNLAGTFQYQQGGVIDGTAGHGINIDGNGLATVVQILGTANADDIGGVGDDAISILDTTGAVTISDIDTSMVTNLAFDLNNTGPVTITNGLTFADVANGQFINQTGTHNINDANLTSLIVDGGNAAININNATFTNATNIPTISVLNGNSGSLTADAATTFNVTNGSGFQFDNADGTYTFNGTATLNGGDAGIDILNGSAGTFTFADTTITSPSGTGLNIDGSTANVTYSGGSITQANNAATVNINNHATGTVNFGIDINATNGTGLQFNNADGTYNFNTMVGTTTLNGGDAGIDILGGSAGTFTFANTTITSPTGTALNIDSSTANVTYSGGSITQASNAAAVNINNHATGTVNFGIDINATNGTGLQYNNADGTYNFNTMVGTTTLNGGDAGIDILGGSAGTFTFTDTDITDPSGTAVNIDGGSSDISFGAASTITQNNNQSAVDVSTNPHTGTLTFNGDISTTNGNGLQFDQGLGTYTFNGTNTLNGGDAGIDIFGASSGAFTFSGLTTINNTSGGEGVRINSAVTSATFSGGLNITTTTGTGFSADAFADNVIVTGSNSIVTNSGTALNLDNITTGTGGINFDTIAVANGGTNDGIVISSVTTAAGAGINIGSANLDGHTNDAIDLSAITGAGGFTLTSADIDLGAGGDGVAITGANTGATINIGNGASNSVSGLNIDGGNRGVVITAASGGDINIASTAAADSTLQIGSNTPLTNSDGIFVSTFNGGTLNIGNATTQSSVIAGSGANNNALHIQGTGTTGTVNINNVALNVSGTGADDTVEITNNDGAVTLTSLDINGSGNAADDHGIQISDNNAAGTVTINGTNTIDNTGGDGINLTNTVATISGVTLGGAATGATDDISGAGIQINNDDGNDRTVDLSNITMGANGDTDNIAGIGVDINSSGTGVLTVNLTGTNNIHSTGQALDVDETGVGTADNLLLTVSGSRFESLAAGVPAVEITGQNVSATESSVGVRGFLNNSVVGNGTGGGILFTAVDFDADGAGTQLNAGNLDIGTNHAAPSALERVQGDGVSFISTTGDLAFTSLNVANNLGTGLEVDTKGFGTTFSLGTGTGIINTTNGTGVFLDPLTANVTLASVTASGGTHGIELDEVTGLFHVTGAISITDASMAGIAIHDTPLAGLTALFNGTITINNSGGGNGVNLATNSAGTTVGFQNGLDITTANGAGFSAIGGGTIYVVDSPGTEQITTTGTGGALVLNGVNLIGLTGVTFDSISSTNSAGDGVSLTDVTGGTLMVTGATTITNPGASGILISNNAGTTDFMGTTNVTDAGGNAITLDGNSGAINFGVTNIDMGSASNVAGISYQNANAASTFGTTTISDVGNAMAANQVGIDFNGATLTGTAAYDSVAISAPAATSTSSIGVDLTGIMGDQIVNLGSQVNPAGGPSSSITDLHRGVVIDATAAVQFTFGDGEDTSDIASAISVNAQAGAYTVDLGGVAPLPASNFDFEDVVFTGNANLPASPGAATFVSTGGGMVAMGVNGLSQAVTTITVAAAEGQANTGQTFVFVGDASGVIDLSGGGADGFTLADGQIIDGFNNGNTITFGSIQPTNVTGNLGATGGSITANSAVASNSNGAATTVVTATAGNNTIENNIFDGTGTVTSLINVAGASNPVVINAVDLQNIGAGDAGINLNGNSGTVMLTDVDLIGTNTGTALQIDATTSSTATVSVDAASDIDGTTGTVVSIGAGARNVDLSAVTIVGANNTDNVIDITGQSAGSISFGSVAITGFNDAAGTAVNAQGSGGNLLFADLDITATDGDALAVGAQTLDITNTDNDIIANSGQALDFNGTAFDAGGVTFDQVTSNASAAEGVDIDNTSGGTLTLNSIDIDNSTNTGIDINGASGTFSFGATSINNAATAGGGVEVDLGAGDTATFSFTSGLDIDTSTGSGFDADGSAGTLLTLNVADVGTETINTTSGAALTLNDVTLGATGVTFDSITATGLSGNNGIDLVDVIGGTLTVNGGTITNTGAGTAVNINGGNSTINIASNIDSSGATGLAADITGRSSSSVTVSGNLLDDGATGGGISVHDNTGGSSSFTSNSQVVNTGASTAINSANNTNHTVSFTNGGLDIDTTSGTGLSATNGGTVNVSGAGNSITTTSGTAVSANSVVLGVTLASVTASALAGNRGIHLVSTGTGSNLDIDGGTLTSSGVGDVVQINGGAITFSYDGNLTQSGNASLVEVAHTAGSTTFNGTLNASNGDGLRFVNADGTHTFNGSVTLNTGTSTALSMSSGSTGSVIFNGATTDIDTTSANAVDISGGGTLAFNSIGTNTINATTGVGFEANGGGTLTVTGSAEIATTTGTAVDIQNTTIGAGGVTFESVSVNGAANGIVLNSTGTLGGLTITGDGTASRNNSGGTLLDTTGSAILLTNTSNVDINHLDITDAGIHAVQGTGVTNFNFRHSTISGIGLAAADDHNAIDFVAGAQSVTGTVLIDNVAFTNFEDTGVDIFNTTGTVNVTVSNSDFSNNHLIFGNEGVAVESGGTALFNLDVTDNTFTNLQGEAVSARVGGNGGTHDINIIDNNSTHALNVGGGDFVIQMFDGSADAISNPGNVTFDIQGNTIDHASLLLSGDPIQIVGDGNATGRIGGANVSDGNTISGYGGDGIRLDMGGSSAASAGNITWNILIQNNTIGVAGNVGQSHSATADDAIGILSRDHNGTLNLTIEDNIIHNTVDDGISLFSDEDSPSSHTPKNNVRIVNNQFNGNITGDEIRFRTSNGGTPTVCTHIVSNTATAGSILLDEGAGSIEITQASTAALNAANTGLTASVPSNPISFGGTCTNPTLPTNP